VKISDQLILAMSDNHDWEKDIDGIKFARKLIELAQEVGELAFEEDEFGNLHADTPFGEYWVYAPENQNDDWLMVPACGTESSFSSKEYAVELANDIHKAKIIKGLKYGGGE
jgi:hypothetical protein